MGVLHDTPLPKIRRRTRAERHTSLNACSGPLIGRSVCEGADAWPSASRSWRAFWTRRPSTLSNARSRSLNSFHAGACGPSRALGLAIGGQDPTSPNCQFYHALQSPASRAGLMNVGDEVVTLLSP